MGFEEFINLEDEVEENETKVDSVQKSEKIGYNQLYDIVTGKSADWQSILYDLIHAEQLDPWDIDIILLTKRYFEKIIELEEQDFYISSKVLLAASLLLRIKSDFLLNKYLKSIDEILFGKKEEKKNIFERIEINEGDLPILIPKTPLPRYKKVTLNELISALNRAIDTETRRIKREVAVKRAKKLSEVDFPSFNKIDLKDRIKQFYAKILTSIKKTKGESKLNNRLGYLNLIGCGREEKLVCFLPLLHLSNTKKLWLEQENHLDEIWMYLYEYFEKNKKEFFEELEEDTNIEEFEKIELVADLAEDAAKEVAEELVENISELNKEEQIEEITGFENSEL